MPASTLQHILQENYIIAKIHGEKSFLLGPRQIHTLTELRAQSEIVGALSEGPYGRELSKLREDSSPIETERAIRLSFAQTVRMLISSSQGSERAFLLQYTRRFDAYDLAALILFKAQGKSWEEFLATRQPLAIFREAELHRMYSTDDLHSIIAIGGDRRLEARTLSFSMTELEGLKASLLRDVITGWGEERFYKYINDHLSGADRSQCGLIAGAAVDVTNIAIILRSKLIGTTAIREHLIPSFWKLDHTTVEQLLTSQDVSQALDSLASHHYYSRTLVGARQKFEESKSLSFLELALRKLQLKLSQRIFVGFPYSLGTILAFLVFKENEAKNINAVLTGLDAGLQQNDLRSLLALSD
ncbi:MAG TPA: V-type ATPase subunit [Candidatus Angelobacter sp.]|nr:V-type ATPase subunit [Candidatus Angelobacter sp.]